MIRRLLAFTAAAAALAATPGLRAQDASVLTKEQMAAASAEGVLSVPTPGEVFAAVTKVGKPDWQAMFRKPMAANFGNRQQVALNLGGLIADGYLAVEARDGQQVKNIARDIKAFAAALGVGGELLQRGNTIVEFAEAANWDALQEELEAAQNEVISAMLAHEDQNMVTLVVLGGWARGLEIASGWVAKNHSADGVRLLRQPAIARTFVNKLNAMPERVTENPIVRKVRLRLFEIAKAVNFPVDAPPDAEAIAKLHELAAGLGTDITTREK